MRKLLLLTLPLLILLGCKPKQHGPFIVSGKIEHPTTDKVYLMEVPFGAQQPVMLDSTTLSAHGTFELRAYGKEESLYVVGIEKGPEVLIINDGNNIKIRLDVNSYKTYTVEGSDASVFLHQFLNQYDSTFSLLKQAFILTDSLSKKDSSNQLSTVLAEKEKQMKNLNALVANSIKTTVSPTVACYISSLAFRTMELIDIKEITDEIAKKFKDNDGVAKLKKIVDAQVAANPKLNLMNKSAPEISVKDTAGNPVSLASFKGKYLLLDFWASWCRPCREENPNVVAAYNEFKDKNFTILSISLDSSIANWKNAIEADGLTWNHASDLKQWDGATVKKYNVESIPFNVLIDPSGKVIATDLRGDALKKKLTEVLK